MDRAVAEIRISPKRTSMVPTVSHCLEEKFNESVTSDFPNMILVKPSNG
jgi:hypothetical protein